MVQSEKPVFRRLIGYAFDPSLSNKIDTVLLNQIVFKVRWDDYSAPGPIGEYLEVIDYDPASKLFYHPVDLDDKHLLATDGILPSESNPCFHQQMVYAVAMTTIQNFEKALGRKISWYKGNGKDGGNPIEKLRIYPHATRDANAYYNRAKGAILFGYFTITSDNHIGNQMPNGLVFTCLSHDIIAHEVTHAILDGINPHLLENHNIDSLAFHEAFSDIVALFQHFTFPEVLRSQIAQTRGNLFSDNLLGQLATQFGEALGKYGSLRDAIGIRDELTGEWIPKIPDPREYETLTEPHDRGAILVAAVFDAFIQVYKFKVADLIRINSNGSGILNPGELHPDMVKRLAREASKVAQIVLNMCIRALDYCPVVDLTFGDYLRAIITADIDLVPEDPYGYRISFIEAFRKRGIYATGVKSLSSESLRWNIKRIVNQENKINTPFFDFFKGHFSKYNFNQAESTKIFVESFKRYLRIELDRTTNNIIENLKEEFLILTDLVLEINEIDREIQLNLEISDVYLNKRTGPDGRYVNQAIIAFIGRSFGKNDFSGIEYCKEVPVGFRLIHDLDSNYSSYFKYSVYKSLKNDVNRRLKYLFDLERTNEEQCYSTNLRLVGLSGKIAEIHH